MLRLEYQISSVQILKIKCSWQDNVDVCRFRQETKNQCALSSVLFLFGIL